VIRTDEYKQRLLGFIEHEYCIKAVNINPVKRGFYGETWRLKSEYGIYFLKLVYAPEHKHIFKRSFPIIQHLCDHGIDFISTIIKSKDGNLASQFDDAVLGVFDWIEESFVYADMI